MRPGPAFALALLVVLAGCAGALGVRTGTPAGDAAAPGTPSPAAASPTPAGPASTAATAAPASTPTPAPPSTATATPPADSEITAPPDPASDRLGWEGGLWHNESIAVDPADGLNETELAAVTNRSMARVERIRGLEFERTVPVEVIARSTYRERVDRRSDRTSPNASTLRNVAYEAAFLLGENRSGVERAADTRASTALGYYAPAEDRIVIVSENATAPKLDEVTLSQELFHALQSREFDAARVAAPTRELHNARDGIVEGDGNYVDHLYERRCEAEWNCLTPDRSGGGGGGDVHVGIAALRLQPYSDGPPFVRDLRREGGWDAVDAVYADPPASTEQTIHPAAYGEDEPTAVELVDASTGAWVVPDVPGAPDYESFGEAGLYVALWYPSVVASREAGAARTVVIPYRDFFETGGDDLDRYDYESNYTTGWDGDLLVPYAPREPAATNGTGYVWKTVWDSERDAAEFADGYRQLLSFHDARRLDARPGADATVETWRIPDGPFADAFRVVVREETVLIVNAPTVDGLDGIRPPPDRGE